MQKEKQLCCTYYCEVFKTCLCAISINNLSRFNRFLIYNLDSSDVAILTQILRKIDDCCDRKLDLVLI